MMPRIEEEQLIPMFREPRALWSKHMIDIGGGHVPSGLTGITPLFQKGTRSLCPDQIFGHNAVHAWLGFLAQSERMLLMSQIGKRDDLMRRAMEVFKEVGQVLSMPILEILFFPMGSRICQGCYPTDGQSLLE